MIRLKVTNLSMTFQTLGSISTAELANFINGNKCLSESQKENLIEFMRKYKSSLTSRPRKCRLLGYQV
jgi:hypothetical protein